MNRGYTLLWRKTWANPLLCEPGKKYSRLEAWLYLANVLAAGMDDEKSGLMRGEFGASSRYLARKWNWPRTTVQRFFKELEAAGMISRIEDSQSEGSRINTGSGHQAGRLTGHQENQFIVRNYETYNPVRAASRDAERAASRAKIKEVEEDTHVPSSDGARVSPKILVEIYRQHNQALPEVKALTSERLKKCRSRIDQAVRDGCLEPYLADFTAAVRKAQQTPFLRGEGSRGWRASFDWFVANHVNIYAVIEGKYDGPAAGQDKGNGGGHASDRQHGLEEPGSTSDRRTSRGDPVYIPRQ